MRSFKITEVWDIPVRIHISLLVVLPLFAWLLGSGQQIDLYAGLIGRLVETPLDTETLTQGTTPWVVGTAAAVGLFVSVTLHELGHAWAALRYDLEVSSITLWILGGLASFEEIPREWDKEFWIAVAGPITSLLVGAACYGVLVVLPASLPVALFVVGWLAVTNVVLAVFNMLPAFPMDGGRVLRALLARTRPYASATRLAASVGKGFAILFAVAGLVGGFNPMLVLLALFIYGAASGESRTVVLADLLEGVTVADVAQTPDGTIDADATVSELVTRMFADRRTQFAVVEDGDVVGVITSEDFRAVPPADRDTTTVATLMATDLPTLTGEMAAFDALVALDQARANEAFVTTPSGTSVISRADFASALEMRRVLGTGDPF